MRDTCANPNKQVPGFRCCCECASNFDIPSKKVSHFKLPKHAVANGFWIGEAPSEIQELNPLELSLVLMTRIDKHVFSFYGGCHKSLRGWHNMYETDVEHVAGTLMQLKEFGIGSHVACLLVHLLVSSS